MADFSSPEKWAQRIVSANSSPVRVSGKYVLYRMVASRRLQWNHALDRAIAWSSALDVPLLVVEALRHDYPWANQRHHRFILDGMLDNAMAAEKQGLGYRVIIGRPTARGSHVISALVDNAAVVITDYYPCFFLPKMISEFLASTSVRAEAIDSNGVYPLTESDRAFPTAHSFRRHLQKNIHPHLNEWPEPLPDGRTLRALDPAVPDSLGLNPDPMAEIQAAIDHPEALSVPVDVSEGCLTGGSNEAHALLDSFVDEILPHYHESRNAVEERGASWLSPYLHYGHISSAEIVARVLEREGWTSGPEAPRATGSRTGWWGLGAGAEAFLDQIITWRELGYHFCHHVPEYDQFSSLPDWALKSIEETAKDERPTVYSLEELERAQTRDPIWNAAQRELVETGLMHNYLRMLWGKKVLQWSPDAKTALERLIHLNNKYALDGRDPNSYSGIFWVFGRFDRAWGPVRPIFGKLRYMTSDSTARKLNLNHYLVRFG